MSSYSSLPEPEARGPGQESAWDYPRPPRLEPIERRLRVVLGGEVVADTVRGFRVLETSHPPNYYLPPEDIVEGALTPAHGATVCEWKGRARFFTVHGGDRTETEAAWCYDTPSEAFTPIRCYVAFYAQRMDACFVDDEQVTPQPGRFYGGWITPDVVGPFKGGPGSRGW